MATTEKPLAYHRFRGHDIRMWRDADHVVRFTANDIRRVLHAPLMADTARWSYDDLLAIFGGTEYPLLTELFAFLRHELSEYDRGVYGPVEIPAAPAPTQPLITMAAAAARIGDTLGRVHTSRDLWAYLVDQTWVTKTDRNLWIPNPEQINAGHLDVLDVPIKGRRDLYPQIHLTADGLAAITKLYLAAQEQPA